MRVPGWRRWTQLQDSRPYLQWARVGVAAPPRALPPRHPLPPRPHSAVARAAALLRPPHALVCAHARAHASPAGGGWAAAVPVRGSVWAGQGRGGVEGGRRRVACPPPPPPRRGDFWAPLCMWGGGVYVYVNLLWLGVCMRVYLYFWIVCYLKTYKYRRRPQSLTRSLSRA